MVMHCACNLRESECGYPKCHNGEKDMNEELATLRQQLAEAQRDAARYRFIRRKNDWFDVYKINHMGNDVLISTAKLDAAIDHALREGE